MWSKTTKSKKGEAKFSDFANIPPVQTMIIALLFGAYMPFAGLVAILIGANDEDPVDERCVAALCVFGFIWLFAIGGFAYRIWQGWQVYKKTH